MIKVKTEEESDGHLMELHIDQKVEKSKAVVREAMDRFGLDNICAAITGGKDSTLNLWLFKTVCDEMGVKPPRCMFIDEGDVFEEIQEFVSHIKKLWSLDIAMLKNEDVTSKAGSVGAMVRVGSLNQANLAALAEIAFREESFEFIPDSTVCNHLMKTVPMRQFILENGLKAVSTAIRWDEQAARNQEEYFSPRSSPEHSRVHPILHFTERDIWIATFKYGIPYNSLYRLGYRSLGARCATSRESDVPAWMQDLENTPERAGRGQDKEKVMGQLRALGYM